MVDSDPLSDILLFLYGLHVKQEFQRKNDQRKNSAEKNIRRNAGLHDLPICLLDPLWKILLHYMLQSNQIVAMPFQRVFYGRLDDHPDVEIP